MFQNNDINNSIINDISIINHNSIINDISIINDNSIINDISAINDISTINDNSIINDSSTITTDDLPKEKVLKKRGRKVKNKLNIENQNMNNDNKINIISNETNIILNNYNDNIDNGDNDDNDYDNIDNELIKNNSKPLAKKRGRKPKGGKIIHQVVSINNNKEIKPNIILHLKCFLKDLHDTKLFTSNIDTFNFSNLNNLSYEILNEKSKTNDFINIKQNTEENIEQNEYDTDYEETTTKDINTKNIWKKLKILEHNFHINNTFDKKSACFWCTYNFDNPPIYIPKYYVKNSYQVYGCFCSPECATAYLMEENIDTSSKFERYYLINHIYSKIYDYEKNVKPAPNPYYMLEKFYGNLTIQEYRSLLKNERLFLVVDKPLTRILPELHEDNDDFIINNKIIPSNNYKIKKNIQNKQTKNNILNQQFGLT